MRNKVIFFLFCLILLPSFLSASDKLNNVFPELMSGKEVFEIGKRIDNYSKELFSATKSISDDESAQKFIIEELSFITREIATIAIIFSKSVNLAQVETSTDFGYLSQINEFSKDRLSVSYDIMQFRGNQIKNSSCVYYINQAKKETRKLQEIFNENSKIFNRFSEK